MNNYKTNKISKVLAIDDQKEIQFLIKMSLELMKEWVILTCSSLEEVFTTVEKEEKFDLILLDYLMPNTNGKEMIIELRKNPLTTEIPVIFLTAQSQEKLDWRELGAIGIIKKPFDSINLGNLIEEIFNNELTD